MVLPCNLKMAKMENEIKLDPIGEVHAENGSFYIQVKEKYRDGLTNIHGFSHLQIVWWGHLLYLSIVFLYKEFFHCCLIWSLNKAVEMIY